VNEEEEAKMKAAMTNVRDRTLPEPTSVARDIVLSVERLSKSYGARGSERPVLDGVDVDVARGEFVCIVGPSGTGKTTLLRCLAGLLQPTTGTVKLDGVQVVGPPEKLAVVFQDYSRSLLPWMTIGNNVLLPLRGKGISKSERQVRMTEALEAVNLRRVQDQYPWQLSGGMQQRVAIARALAFKPEALLMDEPFASVDAQTRSDLEDLILGVREKLGVTVVLVTHDIDEAVYLSDRVVVLGGSPSAVIETVVVDLGSSRSQIDTKADPKFVSLRTHVLGHITARASA
jgi:NitT/TauT family transport system ATP-binding protein